MSTVISEVQHIFFIDEVAARLQYEKALEVSYENGHTLRQFCYYNVSNASGPIVSVETPYLVGLPTSILIDFFKDNLAYPVPTQVKLQHTEDEEAQEFINQMKNNLLSAFAEVQDVRQSLVDDALFTQPIMALWMAKQQIKIYKLNRHVAATQICYAIGEPPEGEETPKNLIFLPENRMSETIYEKSCRPPKILIPSPFDTIELMQQGRQFLELIQQQYQQWINQKYIYAVKQARSLKIDFSEWPKKPIRVMISVCYYTTVMRYASESMAQAFEKLGCEVLFLIDDPYSYLIETKIAEAYLQFKPHLTFNINHLNNQAISPDTFNIIWWQDMMPELYAENRMFIRERDLHYAFSDYIMERVKEKGVTNVEYQEQCASEEIYSNLERTRRDVIVYVGSSYHKSLKVFSSNYGEDELERVLFDLKNIFYSDAPNKNRIIYGYAEKNSKVNSKMLFDIWNYITRNEVINKLIEEAPFPVEIYGYDWQDNPKTAPFYKGPIENGEALAELYRSVRFGLSVQSYKIGHQRLAEIKFCGAIPLVYWTPNRYEYTDYRDEVIAFSQVDELLDKLKSPPKALPSKKILNYFTYTRFARRVIERVECMLNSNNQN